MSGRFKQMALRVAGSRPALPMVHRVALLRPTKVSVDSYELRGADVPPLFHAGPELVADVDARFFEGWYGWGFYAAFDPEFVRKWYGPVVTRLRVLPDVRVLAASVDYSCSPPGLLEAVLANDLRFSLDGDESKLAESRERLMENPVQWVHGVDRLAIEQGYDVVVYFDENVVVKSSAAVLIEGEAPPPSAVSPLG